MLLGILGLGLALRLLHFWALTDTAFLKIHVAFAESDMHAFWQWAQTILAGDLLGRNTYHPAFRWMMELAPLETWYRWWGGKEIFQQAPFYAYWLASLSAVSGSSAKFIALVQLLLGALHPLVLFGVAARLFDVRVGLVAAGLTALYGPFVFQEGTLLRDWLPPLVEPLVLLLLLRARTRERARDWLLAGATLGLGALIREAALLLLPVIGLWLGLEYRSEARRMTRAGALVLAGLLLALSPLFARNVAVGAPLLALSNRAAEGIIEGNAADGAPVGLAHPPSMRGILDRSDGRLWSVAAGTLETYHGDTRRFARLQFEKLRGLVDPWEVPSNHDFAYALEISPVLRFTLRYGILLPLGLAGVVVALRQWRRHRLLALYGLATVLGLMVVNILGRYRLVLVPVLIAYGAAGMVWWGRAAWTRQVARATAYVGLVSALAVIQHLLAPLAGYTPILSEYAISAHIYAAERRFDRAVAEMERLQSRIGGNPGLAQLAREASLGEANARAAWAAQLIEAGKAEEARQQLELATATYARHPDGDRPSGLLGLVHLKLNEPEKAKVYFREFLERHPTAPGAERVRRLLSELP